LAKKNPGWRKLTGIFFGENACHPEPFLSHASKTKTPQPYQAGIKREKDLAELLRRAKSHA
jgi:hypothetical protein